MQSATSSLASCQHPATSSSSGVSGPQKHPKPAGSEDASSRRVSVLAPFPAATLASAGKPTAAVCKKAAPSACQWTDARLDRIRALNQRLLDHICTDTPVTGPELLLHMIGRRVPLRAQPGLVQVSSRRLAEALGHKEPRWMGLALTSLPHSSIDELMTCPALAAELVRQGPWHFSQVPKELITASFVAPLLPRMQQDKRDDLLCYIAAYDLSLALSLAPVDQVVRCWPDAVLKLEHEPAFFALCCLAVERNPGLLPRLQDKIGGQDYEQLCDRVLASPGGSLAAIPDSYRTPERVDKALAAGRVDHIADIPEALRDGPRLRLALEGSCVLQYSYSQRQLDATFCRQWQLWQTLKRQKDWLGYLPEAARTEALCVEYVAQYPARACSRFIPQAIRQKHPEWMTHLWQGQRFMALRDQTGGDCVQLGGAALDAAIKDNSGVLHGQGARLCVLPGIPPWALLLEGYWGLLPPEYKEKIRRNGGSEGLGEALGVPDFHVDPRALLDPVQDEHCTLRASWIPGQVARKLLFCDHFRLRRKALGDLLRHRMVDRTLALEEALAGGKVPLWLGDYAPSGTVWTARGGRTLVRTQADGRVVHMKFQRQGESLASLAAEQAVQEFAREHVELGWQSEIPLPQGMVLVPPAAMPLAPEAFADSLQLQEQEGKNYCLAFRFTTEDNSYDTLAWQPDEPGGECSKAREGLLRAFHDLGIWSSLGAVHTSTIALYHHFYEIEGARPELLLSNLFQPGQCYPGTLHLWNTESIERSDWGWSGLRDLGDLEFYPFITSYIESADARWMLEGYGQRASFVNAMAHNILGGLLHYMRAYREQPDYHYHNEEQITRLGQFLEEACNRYLATLLGDGTRLEMAFPAGVYQQWLYRTAREMIYWTARQTEGQEGFGLHFNRDGRPCAELYPGHPQLKGIRYGVADEFTEEAGESLGTDSGKLPLFYLMRGIYMLTAKVADRLGRS